MVHQEAVEAEVVSMAIKVTMAMLLCLMADMAITEEMGLPTQVEVAVEELLPQEPIAIAKKEVLAEMADM
jgi:saccharopine dehydrogenase-like NADP-dependent oxidoreductase